MIFHKIDQKRINNLKNEKTKFKMEKKAKIGFFYFVLAFR